MNTSWLIHALAASPFFAGRVFLASFVTAALARWWEHIPLLRETATASVLAGAPDWFTHDVSLAVLATLAFCEILADKQPELRRMLGSVTVFGKAAVALAVQLALLDGAQLGPLDAVVGSGGGAVEASAAAGSAGAAVSGLSSQPATSGLGAVDLAAALLPALSVGVLAWLRGRVLAALHDLDPGDDLHLQRLLSWMEDGLVVTGLVFAALLPLIALGLFAGAVASLLLLERTVARRERARKEPCSSCGQTINPAALACLHCDAARMSPAAATLFGRITGARVSEPEAQRFALLCHRRCPRCATSLPHRRLQQPCPSCGTVSFDSREALDDFLGQHRRRLFAAVGVCAVAGAAPLLGLVPAVLFYRWTAVSPLVRYLSFSGGFLARWLRRLLYAVLIVLQLIPLVGALSLSLLALADIGMHRRMLQREAEGVFRA